MISASLYIIVCTREEPVRVRLRRLREPRYLIGAIVGAAYLYFSFFARFRATRRSARRRPRPSDCPESMAALFALLPALGGVALLVVAAAAWLLPVDSGLLEFSDAELQFLFPAPVSRRQLLIHRMLRSQLGILFGALDHRRWRRRPTLGGVAAAARRSASWMLLVTAQDLLHRRHAGAGAAERRRRADPARGVAADRALVARASAVVGGAIARDVQRALPDRRRETVVLMIGRVARRPARRTSCCGRSSPLVQPLFADWPRPYLVAPRRRARRAGGDRRLGAAERRSVSGGGRDASPSAAARSRRRKAASSYKVRSAGWTLAPIGPAGDGVRVEGRACRRCAWSTGAASRALS